MAKDKIILHIDMNSYYATLEQQAYPNLRGKPIGVLGKESGEKTLIVGASIEAKKQGVRGPMATWEAKTICPDLIVIPANYDRYIFTSRRIFSLLERFSPDIEVFSIDEAFISLPSQTNYETAILIAKQIKELIKRQIGRWVTCSIGISYGKTLAKLASELQKPDGLTVITPESFQDIAKNTSIEEVCGIGYRLTPRLHRLGVRTLSDLQSIKFETLITIFGESLGSWMKNIAHGIDPGEPRSFRDLPSEKSMSHSYSLPREIVKTEDIKSVLMVLCERLAFRMRRKKFVARSVSLYLRFSDRTSWYNHVRSFEYNIDGYDIYQKAVSIFKSARSHYGVVYIAIGINDLLKEEQTTKSFLPEVARSHVLSQAIDRLNIKYGEATIIRARTHKVRSRILRLPDGRNKRGFLPSTHPFLKRPS